jgi:hypothetical protein
MTDKKMSKAEYARHRGVSRAAVSQWASAGRIALAGDGNVLVSESDRRLGATVNTRGGIGGNRQNGTRKTAAAASGRSTEPAESLTSARTAEASLKAKLAALDYEERIGQLCEVSAATRAIGECAAITRRTIEQIPSRIATRIAAELGVDSRKAFDLLQDEIERVCRSIADMAEVLPERIAATSTN